ncbi:MAG: excinuclease ABC subunit UvrC [Desulfobacterales bacterium]|nr:excinuclease ABC subunit UvrC [Desulfobacterales bacterium]
MLGALKEKLETAATGPGVYLMKGRDGKVIYVGKAVNLKKRLGSYFKPKRQMDMKTGVLVDKIDSFETIVTASEQEALILEATLIKKYRPRYNVILKDDKRYPSLRMDLNHPYPNLTVVRKPARDGARYFGPFSSAYAVKQTLKFINKNFKLRKCKNSSFNRRTRPCLNYQMGICLAPCCLEVDTTAYHRIVAQITLLLKGRTPQLIAAVKKEMRTAAEGQDFERATVLRDRMFALEKLVEKQVVVTHDFRDRDILAVAGSENLSVVTQLTVRNGYLLGSRHFKVEQTLADESEIIATFINRHYDDVPDVPGEILVDHRPEDYQALEDKLGGLRGGRTHILAPQRGEKVRLVRMAAENAADRLRDLQAGREQNRRLIERLQKRLRVAKAPIRIECFDNSNLFGQSPVGAMVVFKNGKPDKAAYRTYKIKTVTNPDDYQTMAEVLRRRYDPEKKNGPLPDLLMLDGGKGQLNIGLMILQEMNLANRIELISIAKKDETRGEIRDKIYKPGRVNAVNFGPNDDLLLFLQQIRDEAHRFAISFHRRRRGKKAVHSVLDDIKGIGEKRKKALLNRFGGIAGIRKASAAEVGALPDIPSRLAQAIKKALGT